MMRSFHVQFTEKNLTHCHVLCTDGCFDEKALFRLAPRFNSKDLRTIFEHRVLRMLLSRGGRLPGISLP